SWPCRASRSSSLTTPTAAPCATPWLTAKSTWLSTWPSAAPPARPTPTTPCAAWPSTLASRSSTTSAAPRCSLMPSTPCPLARLRRCTASSRSTFARLWMSRAGSSISTCA
ncbi:hypothetical protein LPJ70_002399, partial [Coemansia sp. RSA 2708]